MTAQLSDSEREHAAQIVALFSVLIHAWKTNDFKEAARCHDELERLGVLVRIPRNQGKGAGDAEFTGRQEACPLNENQSIDALRNRLAKTEEILQNVLHRLETTEDVLQETRHTVRPDVFKFDKRLRNLEENDGSFEEDTPYLPGPWKVNGHVVEGYARRQVCCLGFDNPSQAQLANLTLIATAPELLDMLKQVYGAATGNGGVLDTDVLEALIAKAEGRDA